MACAPLLVFAVNEPHRDGASSSEGALRAFVEPARELLGRLGGAAILLFVFIVVFRLPDQLATPMQKPLLLDTLEYDLEQFGIARNGIGLFATIAGSLAGGVLVVRIGLVRSLVVAGILQAVSNLGFAWIASAVQPVGHQYLAWMSFPMLALFGVSAIESACGGLVGTVFVAWLMSLCAPRFGASQFALLTAGFALANGLASAVSGFIADDWKTYFVITAVAGAPGLLLLPFIARSARRAAP